LIPTKGYLYRDELLATFLSVAVSEIQSIPPERAAALVLRQFEGDSFDAPRTPSPTESLPFREALDYEPEDVPDGTSLWRAFDDLHPDELRDCLQSMCGDLLADHDHAGEFVVIDGTHIAAWANTREEIDDGEVEERVGANTREVLRVQGVHRRGRSRRAAGRHRDGDRQQERLVRRSNRSSRSSMSGTTPTISRQHWLMRASTAKAIEFTQEKLDCPLLTAINPRRSAPLKAIRDEIKELFKNHGDEIDSPYDALERLPQEQLSEYGVEVGSVEETYIFKRSRNECIDTCGQVSSDILSAEVLYRPRSRPRTQGGEQRGNSRRAFGSRSGRDVTHRKTTGETRTDTFSQSPHLTAPARSRSTRRLRGIALRRLYS